MSNCFAVGLGGFVGSICRYLLGLIPTKSNGFPVITIIINVVGAFALSVIASAAAKGSGISPRMVLFLKVGLCGGFTTFSTFAYESSKLFESGSTLTGIIYILLSVLLSVAAVFTGQYIIK